MGSKGGRAYAGTSVWHCLRPTRVRVSGSAGWARLRCRSRTNGSIRADWRAAARRTRRATTARPDYRVLAPRLSWEGGNKGPGEGEREGRRVGSVVVSCSGRAAGGCAAEVYSRFGCRAGGAARTMPGVRRAVWRCQTRRQPPGIRRRGWRGGRRTKDNKTAETSRINECSDGGSGLWRQRACST